MTTKIGFKFEKSIVEIVFDNAETLCMRAGLPSTKADRYDIIYIMDYCVM